MTKQELLNDLESRVVRVITTNTEDDAVAESAGVKNYIANALVQDTNGRSTKRNIGFYVVDEGTETEAAYYRDDVGAPTTSLKDEAVAYMDTLPFVKVKVDEVNEDEQFIIATAYEETTGGVTTKEIIIYKDGETPTYKELI